MKKILLVTMLLLSLCLVGCTKQQMARNFGGTTTLNLPENIKLINVTWKEGDSIWYLTRPSKAGDVSETYDFQESSSFGVMEGKVIIIEHIQ